ncbi:OLC1v1037982C2 [Oldenlandia corymbosa var. corymbosa]|nr:OLC1v1037982C2 [Oldenlandia corymbosa var. corymbosa]
MGILSSRVSDVSDVEERKSKEVLTPAGAKAGAQTTPFSKTADEGRWKSLNKVAITSPKPGSQTVPDEIGASPVEIARAFMGSRLSEYGPGPSGVSSKGEAAQKGADDLALKPFLPSPRSTCWPGSMAQEQHGYTTPNQRGRQGLHDFPRTPYSRTIYSKSRAKVQTDSKYGISSPNHFKHSNTPFPEQVKYRNDGLDISYGSVGPIRRLRAKYASEVRPRGSIFSKYSIDNPSVGKQPTVYQDNQSYVQKNLQIGETSSSRQPPVQLVENKVGDKPLLNPSTNEVVKRILDQLDKHKPTPQERMNELKLASAWRKSHTEASATPKEIKSFPFSEDISKRTSFSGVDLTSKRNVSGDHSKVQGDLQEESNMKAKEPVLAIREASTRDNGGSVTKIDANSGFFFPFRRTPSEPKIFQEKADLSFAPRNQNTEQLVTTSTDASKVEPVKRPPLHSFGTKPSLPSISVSRRAPGFSMSSDSVPGFSFPVSTSTSTLSEPPTPSVMPFSSGGLVSQPKDSPAIPSYSFGSNNSTRLVFSFPSTSNSSATVEANDLKFNFGSDKKPRVSFSSVGKDTICY